MMSVYVGDLAGAQCENGISGYEYIEFPGEQNVVCIDVEKNTTTSQRIVLSCRLLFGCRVLGGCVIGFVR